jgi:hypothetical protein
LKFPRKYEKTSKLMALSQGNFLKQFSCNFRLSEMGMRKSRAKPYRISEG